MCIKKLATENITACKSTNFYRRIKKIISLDAIFPRLSSDVVFTKNEEVEEEKIAKECRKNLIKFLKIN